MNSNDNPLVANQLPISFEIPVDPKDQRETLDSIYKRIANAVNTKEGALYLPQEQATFQQYFKASDPQGLRPTYRKVIDFGALPNAGISAVPHGIAFDSQCRLTRMYGAATRPTPFQAVPLPFASPVAADSISISVDGTNVYVRTAFNWSDHVATIVIEYTKIP